MVCSWCLVALNGLSAAEKEPAGLLPVHHVKHSPAQPVSGDVVTISARLAGSVKTATLEYQTVDPGHYIGLADPDFAKRWTAIPMTVSGNGDDRQCSAQVPGTVQTHRRLVRYRIKAVDAGGNPLIAPVATDTVPNFAYFVYNGVASWLAAIEPGSRDPKRAELTRFGTNAMAQVQNYILIGKGREVEDATWGDRGNDKEYHYTGTFVANGEVFDHVRYRARGGGWRHAMGKNMWKFAFNKGHHLLARDDYGQPYHSRWSKVNLRSCIQQADFGRRGEQGMYESVGFRLFNLAGVESPRTHWVSLRIIDGEVENSPDQYKGDFWGLYLAIENEDGHFLDEHGLPDGNVYKMMFGQGELSNHGANQVTNKSDLARFINGFHRPNSGEDWWRVNVDLPRYYSYRSIVEAIHHYDISDGKNYDFYLNPQTRKWQVIPWDIDLTWGDNMYGGGHEPFYRPVVSRPAFRLEYQNRLREIRDLLYNTDEAGRLIDECASLVSHADGSPSIVDADRAKWDFHPVMESQHVMRGKAGKGLFYQATRTRDFAGMVRQMKDYVRHRCALIDDQLLTDPAIPATPTAEYTGPAGYPGSALAFKASAFAGQGEFAAMKWRLGEIDPAPPKGKPARAGHYEITSVWESPELTEFKGQITVPPNIAQAGHTYRLRVRMLDKTGRWSHWSVPVQFTAGGGAGK